MAVLVDVAAAVRPDKPSRQMLAGWAGVMILLGVVDEVLPGEQAALGVARCQCLWHNRRDARAFARDDLVAIEVAAVGQGGDPLAARGLLCLERHGRKLMAVVPLIGHRSELLSRRRAPARIWKRSRDGILGARAADSW